MLHNKLKPGRDTDGLQRFVFRACQLREQLGMVERPTLKHLNKQIHRQLFTYFVCPQANAFSFPKMHTLTKICRHHNKYKMPTPVKSAYSGEPKDKQA